MFSLCTIDPLNLSVRTSSSVFGSIQDKSQSEAEDLNGNAKSVVKAIQASREPHGEMTLFSELSVFPYILLDESSSCLGKSFSFSSSALSASDIAT